MSNGRQNTIDKQQIIRHMLPALCLTIFVMSPVLSVQETASPNALYVIFLFVYAIFSTAITNIKRKYRVFIIFVILYVGNSVISTLFSPYVDVSSNLLKSILLSACFIFMTMNVYSYMDLRLVFNLCLKLSCIIALLIILSAYFGYPHNESAVNAQRYSIGITGLYKNPNYLTSFINCFIFVYNFCIFSRTNSPRSTMICVIINCLIIFSIFLAGTRAALITYVLGILLILFYALRNVKLSRKISIFIAGIMLYALILFLGNENINLLEIFLRGRSLSDDSDRLLAWSSALDYFYQSPIWGYGSECWSKALHGPHIEHLHNILLEILLNYGIIGFLCVLFFTFGGITKIKREDRFFIISFIIISGFPLLFQNGVNEVNLWRFILLNRLLINFSKDNEMSIIASIKYFENYNICKKHINRTEHYKNQISY